ncbi:MAG: phospholipase A [Gammaproteobacteria bacterium]|nr:phospholipase A [Gammaproteobacteria bacterium]
MDCYCSQSVKSLLLSLVFFSCAIVCYPLIASESSLDQCQDANGALDSRFCIETNISNLPFVLIPYKPNYFIGSYVDGLSGGIEEYQNFETKFQISFKIPLSSYEKPARCLWIDGTQCITYFAYSQISVWQMTNFDRSAPFRDTNFEPELMVTQLFKRKSAGSWALRMINYAPVDHQSNGSVPPTSRSWNKSYIDFVFEKNKHYVTFKAWSRWPEDKKALPGDFVGDDNENIEKYVGNAELKYFYSGDHSNYSFLIRDSELNNNKINFQFSWSRPLQQVFTFLHKSDLRLYLQYFNGYGETLIDYNVKRERIGLGVMLADWL